MNKAQLNCAIDRVKACIDDRFEDLADDIRAEFKENDIGTEVLEFLINTYHMSVASVDKMLASKRPNAEEVHGAQVFAVICFLWFLCYSATTLHKAGLIPHEDDLFFRKDVKRLDRKFFQLGALLKQKHPSLLPLDIPFILRIRNKILGEDHVNEWK